jgi:hypothetical protein
MTASGDELGPALRRILDLVPEGEERDRFRTLFAAGTRAIDALVELDLGSLLHESAAGSEVELRATLAPLVQDTLVQVREVLALVRERFPVAPASPALDADAAFDELFSGRPTREPDPEPATRRPVRDAVAVIRSIADLLGHDVDAFAEGLDRPRIAGNRFELLAHVAEHRGRFRAGIGEMIHLAATAFAEVPKEDVVPGYQQDVEAALTIRRTVTMLAAAVRAENERLQAVTGEELQTCARRVLEDLETFAGTPAARLLRVQDRLSFAAAAGAIAAKLDTADEPGLRQVVEGLDKFLDSLSVINRREILIAHDREMLAAVLRHLERVEPSLQAQRLERARFELQAAYRAAQRLFGRDPRLDAFLRAARRFDAAALDEPELRAQARALHDAAAPLTVR